MSLLVTVLPVGVTAIKLDPGFLPFYQWCRAQSPPIPVIVVSSGMEVSPPAHHSPRPVLGLLQRWLTLLPSSSSRPTPPLLRLAQPIIRGILAELIGESEARDIDIVANDVDLGDGSAHDWKITYRHPESGFGHDKSKAILPFKEQEHGPTLFFCGDGISG